MQRSVIILVVALMAVLSASVQQTGSGRATLIGTVFVAHSSGEQSKGLRSLKDSVHPVRFSGHRPNNFEGINESGIAAISPLPSARKPIICQNIGSQLGPE